MLVVTCGGLLEGLTVGEGGEGLQPGHRSGTGRGGGGEGTEEFGLDFVVEVGKGAKVGSANAETVAIHVHAHAELAVDDGGVSNKVLNVE